MSYNGAPRPITRTEAEKIAAAEYASRGSTKLSMGSDGGMHYRGTAPTPALAHAWAVVKRDEYERKIMHGEAKHTVFYDSARDTFYGG